MTTYIPSLTLPAAVFNQPAASILLPVVSGFAIGMVTSPKESQSTYLKLKQPPYHPPAYVFGPVWTVLYGLMGYAAHRVWTVGTSSFNPETIDDAKSGATLYTIQLGLNLVWMPLFFTLKRPIEATVDIVALTGTVGYMTYLASKVDSTAAWCLAPYLGWLSFATYICAGAGYLNDWDFSDKLSRGPGSHGPDGKKLINEKDE